MSIQRTFSVFLVLLPAAALSGCVRYAPHRVDLPATARSYATVPAGPLAFDDAVRLLVCRNPELRALRARIAAVNLDPGREPLLGSTLIADGDVTETVVSTDLLSLLGLGPRGAKRALARALRDERIRRHHEVARGLVAELAQAYAVALALDALPAGRPAFAIDAFEEAGLASAATLAAARSALTEYRTEARITAVEAEDARRRILQLVGAAPRAGVEIVSVTPHWPAVPAHDRTALLLARGDLQRLVAQLAVADRRFRLAVVEQYPDLIVGAGGNIELGFPIQVVRVNLPLDAPAEARAAQAARQAAVDDLQAGVLNALHDADAARLALEAAAARLEGAHARHAAAGSLLDAERGRLETDPAALAQMVLILGREVQALRELRRAAIAAARARVAAARAAGWPTTAEVFQPRSGGAK